MAGSSAGKPCRRRSRRIASSLPAVSSHLARYAFFSLIYLPIDRDKSMLYTFGLFSVPPKKYNVSTNLRF
ncbi:hypothetical protein DAI22_03g376900 [Oryza sativa Japonica Group]|nr:hypothetical protein DAI22_03g376900 [Oryza sativa Japonica Group]